MAQGKVLFMKSNTTAEQLQCTSTRSGGNDHDSTAAYEKAGPEEPEQVTSHEMATSSSASTPAAAPVPNANAPLHGKDASWTKKQRNYCHYRNRNRKKGPTPPGSNNNNNNNANATSSDSNAPHNQSSNNSTSGGGGAGNKRAHKRPRRHHKRNSSVKRIRRNTQPAPNNNNEFLMQEHDDHFYYNNQLVDNGNKSLPFLHGNNNNNNGQQQQHHRQRSYSSSHDDPLGLDMLPNGIDQFSSTSADDEEEEAYLARDFSNAYEVVHAERLSTMTKPQLIQEYQLLEERVESLEETLRTVLQEKNGSNNAKIQLDTSAGSSGSNQNEIVNQVEQQEEEETPIALNYSHDYYNSSEDDDGNSGLQLTNAMLSQFQQELYRLRDENRKLRSDNKVLLKETGAGGYQSSSSSAATVVIPEEPNPSLGDGDGGCVTEEMCDIAIAMGNKDLATSAPNLASNSNSNNFDTCSSPCSVPASSDVSVSTSSSSSRRGTMTSPGGDDNVSSTCCNTMMKS